VPSGDEKTINAMERIASMYHYIYKTTNLVNQCYYIGCHSTRRLDNDYLGSGEYLNRAIKKYGRKNFKKEIWFLCRDAKTKFYLESVIVTDDLMKDSLCMNLKRGGLGGGEFSPETRKKINDANRGKKHSPERCRKNSDAHKGIKNYNYGKIGEQNFHYGRKRSLETRKKMSNAQKGEKSANYGKSPSFETRKKLSEAQKGRIPWNKGKKMNKKKEKE
jgi:hypothetical protein